MRETITQSSLRPGRVALPRTSGQWALTRDQRSLLIIIEDATIRFVRDETRFLCHLPEVRERGLALAYLHECLDFIDRRVREIRRGWPHERAEQYEDALLDAVDLCDPERHALHIAVKTALVQKVGYQHIRRAEHLAVAGGLADSAAQCHYRLTGKRHKFDSLRERLARVDELIGCRLLNDGRLPDMGDAQLAFLRLYSRLCHAVTETFTHP